MSRGTIIKASFGRMTDRAGTSATFVRRVTAGYNTSTGAAAVTETTTTVKGFFDDQRDARFAGIVAAIAGNETTTREKRKAFIVPADDLTVIPQAGDRITIASKEYVIAESEPMTADDVTTCYRLFLEDS